MGPRFVIEQFRFRRQGQWFYREFGQLAFLVGPTRSGKSTALEALLHSLFLSSATVMPQVRKCELLQVVFRVGDVRWQATRSGRTTRGLVSFKNLSDVSAAERVFPVATRKVGEVSAGGFVQELLGVPAASHGSVSVGLDQVLGATVVLRQRAIASAFLDGSDTERILTLKAVLGLWDEDLERLEKAATEAKSGHDTARRTLTQFKKLRDDGLLADPDAIRAEHEQKVRDHQSAAARWQEAEGQLGGFAGERGRLDALYRVADKARKKALKKADEASAALEKAIDAHARAEGELAGLLQPAAGCCSRCQQVLPEREAGLCAQCGQACGEGLEDLRETRIAAARAKVEHARLLRAEAEKAAHSAREAAAATDRAAGNALAARDAFDRDVVDPQRRATRDLEKKAERLSVEVEQLKRRLNDADFIAVQEQQVRSRKEEMEQAQVRRDIAQRAHDQRRKELVHQWSAFFRTRLRQIRPAVETAVISPEDFTTLVREHHDEGAQLFTEGAVAGHARAVINIAMLLSLRDLGRAVPAVRVPPLMIIDCPLAGLDTGKADQETGLRLLNTLAAAADDRDEDGYACQIIATSKGLLPTAVGLGVSEIRLDEDHRFFDHAPRLSA
ncbi:hypothetical protein G3I40_30620 [Streptomyces sp. SID14478]|uniref:hypothetical protein n=1 Tax=Streptomyces sp. SID14478 TaxID=2706073 RepID=UPI0013DC02C6|nr:hypothetical protein [Streptomyces sp. SID14478]NEB79540.1 hypothetical protein [Streptomyces sp. SID14478]